MRKSTRPGTQQSSGHHRNPQGASLEALEGLRGANGNDFSGGTPNEFILMPNLLGDMEQPLSDSQVRRFPLCRITYTC
jgi:hypothetical protein